MLFRQVKYRIIMNLTFSINEFLSIGIPGENCMHTETCCIKVFKIQGAAEGFIFSNAFTIFYCTNKPFKKSRISPESIVYLILLH